MKLKKLALNAIAMDHSEMKEVKAGWNGDDECVIEDFFFCKSPSGECNPGNGVFKGTCEMHTSLNKCYCFHPMNEIEIWP